MVDDGACNVLDRPGSTTSADPFLGLQCYRVPWYFFSLFRDNRREANIERQG